MLLGEEGIIGVTGLAANPRPKGQDLLELDDHLVYMALLWSPVLTLWSHDDDDDVGT